MPTSRDMAIFVLTTTTQPITLPLEHACAQGNKPQLSKFEYTCNLSIIRHSPDLQSQIKDLDTSILLCEPQKVAPPQCTGVIILWYHRHTCALTYIIILYVQMNVHSAGGSLLFIEDRYIHDT